MKCKHEQEQNIGHDFEMDCVVMKCLRCGRVRRARLDETKRLREPVEDGFDDY